MNTKKRSKSSKVTFVPAILLIIAIVFTLTSCGFFRKATVSSDSTGTESTSDTVGSSSGDSNTSNPGDDIQKPDGLRYTEDDAYNVLIHSFPDYDADLIKIERTGNMIAEGDSSEYYIFNVSLPIIPETEAPESTAADDEDTTDETDTTAPPEIEMAPPVPYYVSVNGVVHKEVSHDSVDTDYVRAAFLKAYGERDTKTGFAYSLKYEGLIKNNGGLCYSFAVYETDTSGAEPLEKYMFNYIVTTDGTLHAETNVDH